MGIMEKIYDRFFRPYALRDLEAVKNRIEAVNEAQGHMNTYLEQCHGQTDGRLDLLEDEMRKSMAELAHNHEQLEINHQELSNHAQAVTANLQSVNAWIDKQNTKDDLELDYFDFENYFRGPREMIMGWQKDYVKYYEGKQNVLDIGSGRGEFLEVLKGAGISAMGIDLNPAFVKYCNEELKLHVIEGDGIAYLAGLENNSVGGIFASQVIEHLTPAQMIQFLRLSYQKMEMDSYLILETPNPMCLGVFTHAFYIDPSHVKPIHPFTVKYILQKAGFREVEIQFTETSRLGGGLPTLKGEGIENLEAFNKAVEELNDLLYGSQDYAIIARK